MEHVGDDRIIAATALDSVCVDNREHQFDIVIIDFAVI